MMNERAPIVPILENPADDQWRLIYADWCEENGQPERGEFIRVQVELAPLLAKGGKLTTRQAVLIAHQETLLGQAASQDWTNLPGYVREWQWRRGFVEHVTLTAEDWIEHGDYLLGEWPIQEVTLTTSLHGHGISQERRTLDLPTPCSPEDYVKARWPRVKKWNLPPSENWLDLVNTTLRELGHQSFQDVSGELQASMVRNQAIRRAIERRSPHEIVDAIQQVVRGRR